MSLAIYLVLCLNFLVILQLQFISSAIAMKPKGPSGQNPSQCETCGCIPGNPGIPGSHGTPGNPGNPGNHGLQGPKGDKGEVGYKVARGEPGFTGVPGHSGTSNWKQCAWKNVNSDLDNGKISECSFVKKNSNTHLRVVYQGNMRILTGGTCNRWFFTFNGAECSMPIDTAVFSGESANIIRTASIEGYCPGISRGRVKVALNVGSCPSIRRGNAYTSWNSVSRIIVEEVDPPQS
ncbi:hypothetical protein ACROYT_G011858 [Oculina patagonica]